MKVWLLHLHLLDRGVTRKLLLGGCCCRQLVGVLLCDAWHCKIRIASAAQALAGMQRAAPYTCAFIYKLAGLLLQVNLSGNSLLAVMSERPSAVPGMPHFS